MSSTFTDIAPREYLTTPSSYATNNDFAVAIQDTTDYFMQRNTLEKSDKESDTEYAARVLDAYCTLPESKQVFYTVDDLTHKLSLAFTQSFDILTKEIAPEVSKIMQAVDKTTEQNLLLASSYQDDKGKALSGNPHKFYLLDVADLYSRYGAPASDIAVRLCSKYSYHVEFLNDSNVLGLINRLDAPTRIDISESLLQAVLEDVQINISSSSDDEVTIATNHPDDVSVDGATPNIIKEDDQSESSVDIDGTSQDESSPQEDTTQADVDEDHANVHVVSGGDNSNVTITINDETVKNEEAEMLTTLVRACVDPGAFTRLKQMCFAPKGQVQGKHLQATLALVKRPIDQVVYSAFESNVAFVDMEKIKINLECLKELQLAGVMYLDIQAVNYTDTLMISEHLLNKNIVNKALADGVDIYPLIRNYLRVYHNHNDKDLYYDLMKHDPIIGGVSYEKVLSSSYAVEQKLIDAKAATREKYQRLLVTSRQEAFRTVVTKYMNALAERTPEEALLVEKSNKALFLNRIQATLENICKTITTDKTANAEDLVYQMFITYWYHDTLVADIYSHLKDGVKKLATSGTMTSEAMSMLKAEAIANIGSKYIMQHFVHA